RVAPSIRVKSRPLGSRTLLPSRQLSSGSRKRRSSTDRNRRRRRIRLLPGQHEVRDVTDLVRVLQLFVTWLEPVARDSLVPLAERDPQFTTGQIRSEASVHTAPESDVRVLRTFESNLVGIFHRLLVQVGGRKTDADNGALRHDLPTR